MADAIVSALLGPILEKLTSRTFEEFGLAWGLKTDLENLESTMSMIQAVLKDAEEKQWKSAAVKNWLRKLKDAAYDAEDVLDEFEIEGQRRGQQSALTSQVRSFFSKNQNPIRFRVKMAHRLKAVRKKLEVIREDRNFHLTVGAGDVEVDSFDWRQTWSGVNESEIYGRKREKEELINSLVNNSGDTSVYAICGIGGLGKTTLAQLIYNEGMVKEHFDLTIWVCVSNDSSIRRLARAMIESIEGACHVTELDPLLQRLHEKLSGKKFLLVLDDVWDEFPDNWSSLKDLLRCGAKGSAVLITTRIKMVALHMEPILLQHMESLSDDDSWLLFERFAFGMRRREDYGNLEAIGRAIVSKCGGVPLAIKALGKLMCLKKKESEWLSIKESEIWDLQEGEKEILPALRLSYTHLPPHLKQCFAFCSIFPKDHVIEKDRLIALWMANGFISCKGQMDLHDKGQEIFTELVGRSFFQEVEEDWEGNITCKMHDLMHDLAQSIMIHECCSVESNSKLGISKTVRHVGFWKEDGDSSDHKCLNVQSLRSLLLRRGSGSYDQKGSEILDLCFSKQKHLRVLDTRGFDDVEKVSQSVCSLKQLRYLDVSGSSIKTLPESITSLQKLQTVNLIGCLNLLKLPKGMKHMKNLMYLDLRGCDGLRCMAAGMGQLTCLRKLSLFIVGEEKGHHIRELERLNYLGDELRITNIGNVKDLTDAKSANLMQKANLQSLSLSWHGNGDDFSSKSSVIRENMEGVLDGLQPHRNLKQLWIIGYGGSEFPNWMMNFNSLVPNLVEIVLEGCGNCEQLPPFGKLQFLKRLELHGMDGVKRIGSDVYGDGENPFPSLVTLFLSSMKSLKVWATVTERGSFPVFRQLMVWHCPVLVEMPIIPSLKKVVLFNVDATLLRNFKFPLGLTTLEITSIPNLKLLPDGLLQNHTLLQRLDIYSLPNLQSLSNQILDNLSSLKSLCIQDCGELESLPEEGLRNLNSLETLQVSGCHRFNSLPTKGLCGLSSLRKLYVKNCKKFASLSEGVRYLTALEDLYLNGCPELNTLPESIQHLTSLRSLIIFRCYGLSCLPNQIGCLTSLSSLKIRDCPNLMSLPDGIRSLNTLKELSIGLCPDLEKRCVRETGEDWPKIAHIPNIQIN